MVDVAILLGSKSDIQHAKKCAQVLSDFGLSSSISVASAHRTPDRVDRLVKGSDASVFVAMAGMSAALPGTVAARTLKPVIGVPLSGKLSLDSVLSTLQMPRGVPVASVALDGAENAALLAVEILSLQRKDLVKRLEDYRAEWEKEPETVEGE